MTFWQTVRPAQPPLAPLRQARQTVCLALAGAALGVFSKWLDTQASNTLPPLLEQLDVRNFLGRLAPWLLWAALIAAGSRSPRRRDRPQYAAAGGRSYPRSAST